MSRHQSLSRGAAALALASAVLMTAPANAASSKIVEGLKFMNVNLHASSNPGVTVRNLDNSHQLSALDLQIQQTKVGFQLAAEATCDGTTFENWKKREGYFLSDAAFGVGDSSFVASHVIVQDGKSIDHTSDSATHLFQLPLADLGHPQIGIDPVAIVLATAGQSLNKVQWLRQDHTLTVKFPLRVEASCRWYERNKVTKQNLIESDVGGADVSHWVREIDFVIEYKGDPQLIALNPQIGQNNQPGGFEAGPQPFEITSMTFQPNMPHHVGACPDTTTIRVFFQGQGKGAVRIRINEGSATIHNSAQLPFDAKNGVHHYDFEIETPKAAPADLNKTVAHDLRLFFRGKGEAEATWPAHYTPMDAEFWKHRCTPVVNPVLGGGTGGKTPGFAGNQQGGAQAKPLPVLPQAVPQKPARKAIEPTRPARQSVQ